MISREASLNTNITAVLLHNLLSFFIYYLVQLLFKWILGGRENTWMAVQKKADCLLGGCATKEILS